MLKIFILVFRRHAYVSKNITLKTKIYDVLHQHGTQM